MKPIFLKILHSTPIVMPVFLFLMLFTATKEGISGNFVSSRSRYGMFASYLTWFLAKINFGFIAVLLLVLVIGFITDCVERSGCLLVALGVFFAFGNHYSPRFRNAIGTSKNTNQSMDDDETGVFIDKHFQELAKPEYQDKSVFYEFLFVILGTLFWGFG